MAARGRLGALGIGRRGSPAETEAVSHHADAVTHLSRVVRASGGEARFTLEALLTGLARDALRSDTLQEVEAALRQAGIQVDRPLAQTGAEGVVRVRLEAPLAPGGSAAQWSGARGAAAAQGGRRAQDGSGAQGGPAPDGGSPSGPTQPGEPRARRRPRPRRPAVLVAAAVALVAASSAGALVIGGRSADRSAARHARAALASAEVALDRSDPASARRLLDDAAHSDPKLAGLAAARARLASAERHLGQQRAAYATAGQEFRARDYAAATRDFRALGEFADAPRRASQARDAGRRVALAQALRVLADDPAGALRWVNRSRDFGDSADARRVARAAQGVLGHQQAERDALARLHHVEAQLQSQSQSQDGGNGSSRNAGNGSSGGNGGSAPGGTSGGSGSGGGGYGAQSGGGSNSSGRSSGHG